MAPMPPDRLKIGVSACFLYPDTARAAFAIKTLQYVEQSVPHWIMAGGALPVMIATGLAMSPGFNATAPWLLELLQGRQTARTLHFVTMLALVAFFFIHMAMILAAGPLNELRSIITGWYRTDVEGSQND